MEEGLLVGGGGRGKRDSRPLLLKLGFALALSIAGYFASQFGSKPRLPPPPQKSKPKSSKGDAGSNESLAKSSPIPARVLKDELHILTNAEALATIIHTNTNEVVMNEFEEDLEKNSENLVGKEFKVFEERIEMEKEIAYFRNLVEALKERERSLEMQMIEYYGLKEQVDSLRELENRLKVNAMEFKFLNLKIESLQADNQKLQAQVSDCPKIVSELEATREEIKHLKTKLKLDGEQTKEKLASLHRRITEMLERERKHEEDDVEVKKKLEELEDEVTTLRNVNSRLAEENFKVVQMLEAAKMAASSDSDHHEVQALEEASHLREENEKLKKEIEQLQTDRCADVEELVYLRWVNACLRYELRNYQPVPGKTIARDLSKCLSPESERKAKQLILEYANSGSNEKNNIILYDFDTESCSSSQTSSEECSDSSFAVSSTKASSSKKSKLVSKLKKLVLEKDTKRSKVELTDGTPTSMRRASVSPCSLEDMNGRKSFESVSSCISVENTSANQMESHSSNHWHFKPAQSQRPPRPSLDVQRMRHLELEAEESVAERCRSNLGTTHGHMRMISEDCLSGYSHNIEHEDSDAPEKVKLKKFASVIKGPLMSRRSLATFTSN